jgi:CRISPR type III-A-associated RAMP protein Csm4
MKLVRFRLQPTGSWRTPWQADTLVSALAAVGARVHGAVWLEQELLGPWRQNDPPFVLSDACPADLLPAPAFLPLLKWPDTERKRVKKAAWLTVEQFAALQRGGKPSLPEGAGAGAGFAASAACVASEARLRNTLDRLTDATGNAGSLYPVPAVSLAKGFPHLSVYARVMPGKEELLSRLFSLLAETGFGADASAGFGHFRVAGKFEGASWLTQAAEPDAWVSLSTFQPGANDPTKGYWQSFVKYGKLGPGFGIDGVFKRPQWMLRPGSCFHETNSPRDWYGRLISTEELLAPNTATELAAQGIRPVHPAFALAVPMKWAKELEI